MKRNRYYWLLAAIAMTTQCLAQGTAQAQKWFEAGEYEKALPVFEKAVKQAPRNTVNNFWYGACLYKNGQAKEALPYLENAAEKDYINAFLYLGRANMELYLFEDAVDNYETHIEWLEKKKRPTEEAEAELEKARQGLRMIKGVEQIVVVDSFVVGRTNLLDTYKLSPESGRIFQTAGGTGFENERGNLQLHTVQGQDGNLQLASCYKLADKWGKMEALKGLSTDGNNAYPFMLGDGSTLYYANDNENSMGGYDIFVTRYDAESGTYLKSSNIGMPFNSPFNDYLYAIDEFNGIGWFASDRYQPEGRICIYIFRPNSSREVIDYDNADPEELAQRASLRHIRSTWTDEEAVRQLKEKLQTLLNGQQGKGKEADFYFVVNDNAVYHNWTDFRSAEARECYKQLLEQQKKLNQIAQDLQGKRDKYAKANDTQKTTMAPAILGLEKQQLELIDATARLELNARNTEIQAITK